MNPYYRLGFSQKEMYRTIGRKKVLLWIPFLIAIIIMWSGILYIDSQSAVSSFGMSIKYSITFIAVYFIFYHFVNIIYRRKIFFNVWWKGNLCKRTRCAKTKRVSHTLVLKILNSYLLYLWCLTSCHPLILLFKIAVNIRSFAPGFSRFRFATSSLAYWRFV